jgi:hypothetical protein|tara:strand:- start:205 stop:453 length:249 start_codon:yes stop_codon:yes gene_type:complete
MAGLVMAGILVAQPKLSGPQQAGDFRKFNLGSDHKQDYIFINTMQDPTELGPDGCLYDIGCGTGWGKKVDTPIVRIENTGKP